MPSCRDHSCQSTPGSIPSSTCHGRNHHFSNAALQQQCTSGCWGRDVLVGGSHSWVWCWRSQVNWLGELAAWLVEGTVDYNPLKGKLEWTTYQKYFCRANSCFFWISPLGKGSHGELSSQEIGNRLLSGDMMGKRSPAESSVRLFS